jgi:prefoldin subunit 5
LPLLVDVKVLPDVTAEVKLLVADVKATAEAIVELGANIEINADVKAAIAIQVAAIIKVR